MADNEKKEKKKGGSVSIVVIIVLIVLIIALILLFMSGGFGLFGTGSSGGGVIGSKGEDAVPANAEVQVTGTVEESVTEEARANVSEYRIEVSEDKISVNGKEFSDAQALVDYLRESYSDSNTYILYDNYAIAETYSNVKKALDSEKINYSEEISAAETTAD